MSTVERCACKICLAVIAIAAADQKYWQAAPASENPGTSGLTRIARDLTRNTGGEAAVGVVKKGLAER
jgi:hypothetical protein